jgi:cyclase
MVNGLKPRLIPCLLLQNGGLVKTTKFSDPKYVGDPLNAVKIFNEKKVDELIILDIEATKNDTEPDFNLIAKLASECRMPLCYGGGVKNVKQIEHIISLGVEKVSISTAALYDPNLIKEASRIVGSQSIVVVIDVKRTGLFKKSYEIYSKAGSDRTGLTPIDYVKKIEEYGAGEIVINSIDKDGTMSGYDIELIDEIFNKVSIPLTILGGASNYSDIKNIYTRYGVIGAAAGSLFVFKGKFRAVLIQYPNELEKMNLFCNVY